MLVALILRGLVFVPMGAFAEISGGEFPIFRRVVEALPKSFPLLVFREVEE